MPIEITNVKKYNYNSDDNAIVTLTADDETDLKTLSNVPVLSGSICTNVVLDYTLNVFFEQIGETTGFKVTKIEADLIYGDVSAPAEGKVIVQRTAATNFL